MNSRRKFIIKSSVATASLLALRPFISSIRDASGIKTLGRNSNQLVILHTAQVQPTVDYQLIKFIKEIKNKAANVILLKAQPEAPDQSDQLIYDGSMPDSNEHAEITSDFKIIHKGNLLTGIISAKPGEHDIIHKVATLSTHLKKEKQCNLVVCLSQLGFRNEMAPDDIALAQHSTDLDIIIAGHSSNYQMNPYVVGNSNNAEVIIHSAHGNPSSFGVIHIEFDEQWLKKFIRFTDHTTNNPFSTTGLSAS